MNFIDTHTHLYDAAYEGDGAGAVRRAIEAGVTRLVMADTDSSVREAMFSLCDAFPENAFPCLGLHPTELHENWRDELAMVMNFSGRRIYAIGETGLDLHWDDSLFDAQKECFHSQLELALKMDLPVIIHSRDATKATFDILEGFRGRGLRGVFHAFSGSIETFRQLDRYGDWFVGIGGGLTFKKASIAETVKDIPLERILLETDSPYLAPTPLRGTRNESANIPLIAAKLSEIKGIPLEEIASVTTSSAQSLFGI